MCFDDTNRMISVSPSVFDGVDFNMLDSVAESVRRETSDRVFIEGYRSRSNFAHDAKMITAVQTLKRLIPGSTALDNMGVKKIITPDLMKVLGVWTFTLQTNHQDLRSAARIALFGMVKEDKYNTLLARIITHHINGNSWSVIK